MSREILEGVKSIGGFEVAHLRPDPSTDPDPLKKFIRIHHRFHTISIQLQNGTIPDVGVNGVQVSTIINIARELLNGFNKIVHHDENDNAIECLNGALEALNRRLKDRILRNVEGTMKE